jgi:hypothetical protein
MLVLSCRKITSLCGVTISGNMVDIKFSGFRKSFLELLQAAMWYFANVSSLGILESLKNTSGIICCQTTAMFHKY